MITYFRTHYKGYQFEIKANVPVGKKCFEKFADESIRYMEQSNLENYSPVAVGKGVDMIIGQISKLPEYELVE